MHCNCLIPLTGILGKINVIATLTLHQAIKFSFPCPSFLPFLMTAADAKKHMERMPPTVNC